MSKLHIGDKLTLPLEAVTQTFGILGKRGGGKTYVARVMAEEMFRAGGHIACIDPIGNWWGLRLAADGKTAGLPITVLGGDYGDVPLEANERAGEFVARLIVEEKLSVVIDVSRFRKGEQTSFMIGWAEALYRLNREALHLFVDEADAWAPQRPVGNLAPRLLGAMEDLVRRGRARGLGMTMITQRSASINKDLLTQIEVLIAKRTIAPQDREAIEAWVKVHGTPEQKQTLMGSLASLPVEDAWFWSPSWLDIFQRVRIRKLQTFDSSATPEVGAKPLVPRKLAAVELEQLRTRMSETIERAKAEDPRELRKRIAELQKELAAKKPAVKASSDPEALKREYERGVKAGRREVATVLREKESALFRPVIESMKSLRDALAVELSGILASTTTDYQPPRAVETRNPHESNGRPVSRPTTINHRREAEPRTNGDQNIGGGALRMLQVLAQRAPAKYTRAQWGTLAGLAHTGGTFSTYLSRLRTSRLVESDGSHFWASEAGINAAGEISPAPSGTEEVLAMWRRAVGGGAARMLDVLATSYPEAMTREQLGDACDIEHTGGTFSTYLSRLRSNGLVTVDRGGIRAAEVLFEGS